MLPKADPPLDPPKVPDVMPPPGACDAHVHMVGGPGDFPMSPGRVEDPADGDFKTWLARYRRHLGTLGFSRGVIVHSILYGTDNSVTAAAVAAMGTEHFRGIGLVTDEATAQDLDELVGQGLVGIRLNYVHGGVLTFDGVQTLAPMLAERGLHVQMLMNTDRHMVELADAVRALPVPIVFDHVGWPDVAAGIDEPGFALLRTLLAEGACWVKLSGVYRLCAAPYDAADAAVAALVAANPEQCLWGSDWPHIMLGDAQTPDSGVLLDAFHRAVPDDRDRRRVLVDNPARLYGF